MGPPESTVNLTELATIDGSLFNSSRLNSRNIVMYFQFLEKPSIETTRLKTYKYFPIKRNIKFYIKTDKRECEIEGIVESNEPTIFSQEEGCQISIICPYPFFKSMKDQSTHIDFNSVDDLFSFPFCNNSLTEDLIIFGNLNLISTRSIFYEGDYSVGITIQIYALGRFTDLTIYNVDTREMINIDNDKIKSLTGEGIVAGDEIIINTSRSKKSVYLIRSGNKINILNCIGRNASWFQLSKGENKFAYIAGTGIENVSMSIDYANIYEGV